MHSNASTQNETTSLSTAESLSQSVSVVTGTDVSNSWDRYFISENRGTLDEQHGLLAYSLAGRSADNYNSSTEEFNRVHNIRYKIGIDRTVIVLGRSVGIELMVEPTAYDARIQ